MNCSPTALHLICSCNTFLIFEYRRCGINTWHVTRLSGALAELAWARAAAGATWSLPADGHHGRTSRALRAVWNRPKVSSTVTAIATVPPRWTSSCAASGNGASRCSATMTLSALPELHPSNTPKPNVKSTATSLIPSTPPGLGCKLLIRPVSLYFPSNFHIFITDDCWEGAFRGRFPGDLGLLSIFPCVSAARSSFIVSSRV